MKKTRLVLAFCFATSILLRSLAAGQSQKTDSPAPAAQKTEAKTATVSGTIVYKPPFRGAPVGRVGGGTRSDVPDRTVVLFGLDTGPYRFSRPTNSLPYFGLFRSRRKTQLS